MVGEDILCFYKSYLVAEQIHKLSMNQFQIDTIDY